MKAESHDEMVTPLLVAAQDDKPAVPVAAAAPSKNRVNQFKISSSLMFFLTLYSLYSFYTQSDHHDHHHHGQVETERRYLNHLSADSIKKISQSYTHDLHIAGSEGDYRSAIRSKHNFERYFNLAGSSQDDLEKNVFDAGTQESRQALMQPTTKDSVPRVWIDTYYPMLNYPTLTSLLTLTPPNATVPSFAASLKENVLPIDPTSSLELPAFHGLSMNGTAIGQLIYAGQGTREEFKALVDAGVTVKGKIAIVMYGGSFRGLKVAAAQEFGAIGCIIYTDPIEDGEITVENGHLAYPDGPARQPSSIQRGSTQFLSTYPGDPLTPYIPAHKNATRLPRSSPTINVPSIPSLPISYTDALPLLLSLNGQGVKSSTIGGLGYLGVEYWTGPGEGTIELRNSVEEVITPVWNTMLFIPGSTHSHQPRRQSFLDQSFLVSWFKARFDRHHHHDSSHHSDEEDVEELVIIGNHRDAWTPGAGDPNSGTAAMEEMVKSFGSMWRLGWRPRRNMLIASWDAEEYGLIGSTEFGEDYPQYLQAHTVAYLNVDVAVSGSRYRIEASPSLAPLFRKCSKDILGPPPPHSSSHQSKVVTAKKEEEEYYVGALGSGSDFTVFLQHLGIASGNLGYSRGKRDPVYHYHSIYDSAYWESTYGDPTFSRHLNLTKVLGLAALRLTDSMILPIDVMSYAKELQAYVDKVKLDLKAVKGDQTTVRLGELEKVVKRVQNAAKDVDREIESIRRTYSGERGHCKKKQWKELRKRVWKVNEKLRGFENGFIDEKGIKGREWYRNLVVAPGRYSGYGATTLPGLTESITLDQDLDQAKIEVERLVKLFKGVAKALER